MTRTDRHAFTLVELLVVISIIALLVAVPVILLLALLGTPFLGVKIGAPWASVLPRDAEARLGWETVEQELGPGALSPITIVLQVEGDVLEPAIIGALYDFTRDMEADPRVERVSSIVSIDPSIGREQYQQMYVLPLETLPLEVSAAVHAIVFADVTMINVFTNLEAASDEAPIEPITAELNDASTAERAGEADWRLSMRPAPNAFDNGGEPLLLLRELERLGAKLHAVDLSALPSLDAMDAECSYLGWQLNIPGALSEDEIVGVFDFTDGYGLELQRIGEISDDAAAPEADVASPPAAQDAPAPVAAPVAAPAPVQPVAAQPAPAMQAVPPAPVPAPTSAPAPSQAPAPAAAAAPSAAAAPAPSAPKVAASQTIRVDFDRLDRLVNLVGELVITQAMLTQRLSDYDLNGIGELSDLDHLTRELQESTMALRAQPMQTVFSRVPRIIRELEGETGKRVRLEIEGEMTEVDKTVVERIGEPLTHLIRNAVDHGLESPEKRVAAGKSAEGVVRLSAAHQSGRIVITVADDGAGINRDRVRQRAVERGIVAPDAALSNEEIDNLIFAPGFSTAETVSNISGRGVGMDVVRRNIQALGGRIGIQSNEGTGSSFSLSLPLTLAVLDGMIVKVGAQTFVIPLTHIVESLRPEERAVNGIGLDAALLDVRGQHVPLLRVARQLGIPDGETDPRSGVLIVVDGDHGPAALMVDSIQDQRQVVVKSLEANYRAIDGLAGATILGDGRVALILDIDTLTARRPGAVPMELAA